MIEEHREALDGEGARPSCSNCWRISMSLVIRLMSDAGLLLGEEVEAEPLEVGEDADPQVVHDLRGEPAGRVNAAPAAT